MDEKYNVVQFFMDESYEYVRTNVTAEEAVKTFRFFTTNVASKVGTTVRVIITDSGDCINMEWQFGKGITYPKREELEQSGRES